MESDNTQNDALLQLRAWLEKNKKQVVYGAIGAGTVALIAWFFVWQAHEKQLEASAALAKVSVGQMMNPAAGQDSSPAYLKIATDYAGSSAAERALLLAGGNLFTQGKYAEAQNQFGRFIREHATSAFLSQAKLGMAACLEAQGKTNEALIAYKDLSERHPNEVATPQAKFALGRIFEAQNQPQQARKYFEDVARTDAGTSLGSESGMRLEELNAKFPPPAPTNSIPMLRPAEAKKSAATAPSATTSLTNRQVPAAKK